MLLSELTFKIFNSNIDNIFCQIFFWNKLEIIMWIKRECNSVFHYHGIIEFLAKKASIDGIPGKLNKLKMLIDEQSDTRSQAFLFPLNEIDRQHELDITQVNQNDAVTELQEPRDPQLWYKSWFLSPLGFRGIKHPGYEIIVCYFKCKYKWLYLMLWELTQASFLPPSSTGSKPAGCLSWYYRSPREDSVIPFYSLFNNPS